MQSERHYTHTDAPLHPECYPVMFSYAAHCLREEEAGRIVFQDWFVNIMVDFCVQNKFTISTKLNMAAQIELEQNLRANGCGGTGGYIHAKSYTDIANGFDRMAAMGWLESVITPPAREGNECY